MCCALSSSVGQAPCPQSSPTRKTEFLSRLFQNCQILPVLSTSLRPWKTCRPLFGSPGNSCFYICRSSQKTHTRALHQPVLPAPPVPTFPLAILLARLPSRLLVVLDECFLACLLEPPAGLGRIGAWSSIIARPVVSLFPGSSLAHFLRACAEVTTLSVW